MFNQGSMFRRLRSPAGSWVAVKRNRIAGGNDLLRIEIVNECVDPKDQTSSSMRDSRNESNAAGTPAQHAMSINNNALFYAFTLFHPS